VTIWDVLFVVHVAIVYVYGVMYCTVNLLCYYIPSSNLLFCGYDNYYIILILEYYACIMLVWV
jgi:hypothetical protein